jgi:hypothetical protein
MASSDNNVQKIAINNEMLPPEFSEYTEDINIFMKKYSDFYILSLSEDQKRIEDINNFQHLLREFLVFLNQKLKTQRERIAKFYLKFDHEKE